jgi:hypothetical protein
MFCGWYIRRDDPSRFIDFRAGDVPENADPIRVCDVAREDIQVKLDTFLRADGLTIWGRITGLVDEFSGCDLVVLKPEVWTVDGRELLDDGNHRACAAYLADPPQVAIDPLVLGVPHADRPDVRAIRLAIKRGA